MKKYEYVAVHCHGIVHTVFDTHREIIDAYAARGYRYVGFIPTVQLNGFITEVDLVFETDVEK